MGELLARLSFRRRAGTPGSLSGEHMVAPDVHLLLAHAVALETSDQRDGTVHRYGCLCPVKLFDGVGGCAELG